MSQSVKQSGEARTDIGKYARGNRYRAEYISGIGYIVFDPEGNFVPNSQTPFKQQAERQRDELQRAEDSAKKRGPSLPVLREGLHLGRYPQPDVRSLPRSRPRDGR